MDATTMIKLDTLRHENRWEDVINLLAPFVETGQADAQCFSDLGFAYSQRDQYDKARYCYKQWLEMEPQRAQPYYAIAYTFYDAGEWKQAIEWFDRALEIWPSYMRCLYRKGVAEIQLLKEEQAVETLTRAIVAWQNMTDDAKRRAHAKFFLKSVFYLGKAHYKLGHYDKALACFKKVCDEDSRHYMKPEIKNYNLAKGYFGAGHYAEAEKILQKMVRQRHVKNYVPVLLARVQAAMGENQKAISWLSRALEKRPDAYIYFYRAEMYQKCDRIQEAVADYQQALRRDKKGKHKTLLALGRIAIVQNRLKEAQSYLERAIAFKKKLYDADYYEARLALAQCFHLAGKEDRAQQEYAVAVRLHEQWEA